MGSAASKAARDQVRRYPKTHKPAGTQIRPEAKSRQAQREPIEQDSATSNPPAPKSIDTDTGFKISPLSGTLQGGR